MIGERTSEGCETPVLEGQGFIDAAAVLVVISRQTINMTRVAASPYAGRGPCRCAERLRTGAGACAATRVHAGRMGARVW